MFQRLTKARSTSSTLEIQQMEALNNTIQQSHMNLVDLEMDKELINIKTAIMILWHRTFYRIKATIN